ncbi:MAG: hypothetical protein A2V67_05245 [Deltaproteobacteria bacterium RBG_13_61_14]|nr:MAG: hypothetical protein A2V67_05245 [Deltaproteobacteria bacterium RBG_13_61_14]
MIKRVLLIALILLLLLAALLIYLDPRNLDPNYHRPQIKAWIESRLNAEVELGLIFPILYPGLGFECHDVELRLKPEPEAVPEDFLRIKSLKVILDRDVLFKERRLLWKELIVDSPSLCLRRGPDKHFVVKNLIKPQPAAPAIPEPKSWLGKAISENLQAQLPDPEHRFAAILNLELVRVNNASLEIVDQGQPKPGLVAPLKLFAMDFNLHGMSAREPGRFKVRGRFPQGRGPGLPDGPLASLSGKLEVDKVTRTATLSAVSGTWGDTRVNQANLTFGSVNHHVRLTLDADLDAALEQLNLVLTWPPIHRTHVVDPIQAWGRTRVKVHLEGPDRSRAWRMRYSGSAGLSGAGLDPGRVIAPLSKFNGTATLANGVIDIPETELFVGGIPVRSSGKIEEAYAPRFVLVTEAEEVDFSKFFMGHPGPAPDPDAEMKPMRSRWEGDAKIGKGFYGKLVAREIQGHWSVDTDRVLRFAHLTCRAYQGTYEDNFSWVSFNHPAEVVFYLNGTIRKMDAQSFIEGILDTTTFVDGDFDGRGYVTGRFIAGEFDTASLNGEFVVNVHNGKLMGYNLFIKVLAFLGLPFKEEQYGQSFEKLRAEVTFRDGVAYSDNLVLRNWDLEAHAAGSIDFVHETLDLRIAVYPLETLSTLTKPIPLLGAIVNQTQESLFGYYAKVQGNWDQPRISPYLPLIEKAPTRPPPRNLSDRLRDGGKSLKEKLNAGQNPPPH